MGNKMSDIPSYSAPGDRDRRRMMAVDRFHRRMTVLIFGP